MALPESNPQQEGDQKNKPAEQEDRDFDPSAEALIDEIDDERTLEEEEALAANNGAGVQEELDDLKKESEMPIEELLAYYERMRNEAQGEEDDEEGEEEEEDEELDDEEIDEDPEEDGDRSHGRGREANHSARPSGQDKSPQRAAPQQHHHQPHSSQSNQETKTSSSPKQWQQQAGSPSRMFVADSTQANPDSTVYAAAGTSSPAEASRELVDEGTATSDNDNVPRERRRHTMTEFMLDDANASGGMFKSLLDYDLDDSDDLDEDYSYTDDENGDEERDWRRYISIGADHQADVPEGLCEYDDLPPYENEDKLVWKCNADLKEDQIVDYLKRGSSLSKRNDISTSPASVPKISEDSLRLYREKMQDITSSTASHVVEHNHENINTDHQAQQQQQAHQHHQHQLHPHPHPQLPHPPENLHDVYMSQSRKRARIDYELEQENTLDGINQATNSTQSHSINAKGDDNNTDSTSQDVRPELSTEDYFQDEEQLLFLLLQCNYNLDEALRRRRLDPFKYYLYEPMSLWSEEECLGFEHGLRAYGKDFRQIRENKVQTRTHPEMVAFYYLWKKSERHDVYTNQYRLDRKRCLSHPGTTDYMDRFIEDNESVLGASSSTTPTVTEISGNFVANSHSVENEAGADSISTTDTNLLGPSGFPLHHSGRPEQPVSYTQNINTIQHHGQQLNHHHPQSLQHHPSHHELVPDSGIDTGASRNTDSMHFGNMNDASI